MIVIKNQIFMIMKDLKIKSKFINNYIMPTIFI